jgi:hypothetical protein
MSGRAPLKNLLIVALFLTVGLASAPFAIAICLDIFSITIYSATGWDLGLGFAQNTLGIWPGGEIISAILFNEPLTTAGLISGVLQVLIVAFIRSQIPPIFPGGNSNFSVGRLLGISLLDSAITCIIAIAVGWFFLLGPARMFEGAFGVFAQIVVGLGEVVVIAACALVALHVLQRGLVGFSFSILTSVGRFALATFALITWSINNIAGSFVVMLCIFASGVLALVDGRESRYW